MSRPWVPDSYACTVTPDGTSKTSSSFTYEVNRWYMEPESGLDYPISVRIVIPSEGVDLTVTALDEQQFLTLRGRRTFSGFGSVKGTIDGAADEGWCYLSPMGRNR